MKKHIFLLLLAACLGITGCARSYELRLTNGRRITTASKPKLQNGFYVFKDARGQDVSVSQGRVLEIAPAGRSKEKEAYFKPSPSR